MKQNLTTVSSLESFLTQAIVQTLGSTKSKNLTRESDLFAFGVDSLQATRIRNICQKELELEGVVLGQNSESRYCSSLDDTNLYAVVYENPSIEKYISFSIFPFIVSDQSRVGLRNTF